MGHECATYHYNKSCIAKLYTSLEIEGAYSPTPIFASLFESRGVVTY